MSRIYRKAKIFRYRDINDNSIMTELLYIEKIKPEKAIKNKNAYDIISIPPQFVVNGFIVSLIKDNIVDHVHIFGLHPNSDLSTKEFCLPDHKKNIEYDEIYYDLLRSNLRTYYLDNAHYIPPKMELKKLKSIYLQFNR